MAAVDFVLTRQKLQFFTELLAHLQLFEFRKTNSNAFTYFAFNNVMPHAEWWKVQKVIIIIVPTRFKKVIRLLPL